MKATLKYNDNILFYFICKFISFINVQNAANPFSILMKIKMEVNWMNYEKATKQYYNGIDKIFIAFYFRNKWEMFKKKLYLSRRIFQ